MHYHFQAISIFALQNKKISFLKQMDIFVPKSFRINKLKI